MHSMWSYTPSRLAVDEAAKKWFACVRRRRGDWHREDVHTVEGMRIEGTGREGIGWGAMCAQRKSGGAGRVGGGRLLEHIRVARLEL
jgi:hypothetical protein